ncbi:MAG TPA: sigma-70 family RNA polymerase sigma factor [Caulobacteraceae bacterium]|nr:sigma-70 family RNA polymerase sigma factor [Caulobacteraceae bacterium]
MGEAARDLNGLVASYVEHRPMLVRLFSARTGSAAAAEDLVQDIYVRIADLDGDAPVVNGIGYLYRVGWNLMLDARRGARRSAARESHWTETVTARVGTETVMEEPSAEAAIDAKRRLEQIVQALEELPPQVQRAFRLHKFDGLSHAQVAAVMGVSRSSVEKHISRALRRLLRATRP